MSMNMYCISKGTLSALCLASALSGCGDIELSDVIHARDNDFPEVRNDWPAGSSGEKFELKFRSHEEVYLGWRRVWPSP